MRVRVVERRDRARVADPSVWLSVASARLDQAADVVYFLLSRGKAKLPEILGAVTATVLEREKDLERARNRGDDVPEDDERSDNEDDDDAPSSSSKAKKDKKGKRRKGDDDEDEAEAVSSGKGLSTKKSTCLSSFPIFCSPLF